MEDNKDLFEELETERLVLRKIVKELHQDKAVEVLKRASQN